MQPIIQIADATQVAGSTMRGTVRLPAEWCRSGVSVSLRLTWATEGKGRHDGAQIDYQLWRVGQAPPVEVPFAVILPAEPWSYDGRLIKIGWTLEAIASHGEMAIRGAMPLRIDSPYLHAQVAYR
jgi:hypothetical protein